MKHQGVVTSQGEYDAGESHCRVCGRVRTLADCEAHIPDSECPGKPKGE